MAFHFIAVMSHYEEGQRIGWHYASEGKLDKEYIDSFFQKVEKRCGPVQFGIHKLSTKETSWNSVVEKDSFFKDIAISPDMESFIAAVSADRKLKAYDIAKFILTVLPASHLKLQKLLYYVYAEFLQKKGKRLFYDDIVAFKFGPVVEDVFHKYRVHGSAQIGYKEDETFILKAADLALTPSFMKIASSEHGLDAIEVIADVLDKYKGTSARELVDKTHRVGGPWEAVYKEGMNCIIDDELIKEKHWATL